MKTYKVTVDSRNTIHWYNEAGQFHKEDGPAVEYTNGYKSWHLNGKVHRQGGPAVMDSEGNTQWLIHGKHHREDGPAIESTDGHKEWWFNNELHREDGPAVERANGDKSWYLEGKELTEEQFDKITSSNSDFSGKTVTIKGKDYILTPK